MSVLTGLHLAPGCAQPRPMLAVQPLAQAPRYGSAAPAACHPLAHLLPCWQWCDCFPGLLIFITQRSAVPTPKRVLGTGSSILPPFCYARQPQQARCRCPCRDGGGIPPFSSLQL